MPSPGARTLAVCAGLAALRRVLSGECVEARGLGFGLYGGAEMRAFGLVSWEFKCFG
jgi:hypothetical protein